ncbi:hypothetical protein BOX15_Mlig026985g2 [Macrostomum lignano]|uniref:Multidrug and toxin extrusion protein n=1 Tax=Macrostomum lignano TaxID=282301 RepID=A0A267EP23_9PLAT|nr:hypothetical protein BOX15_Mlig026985g2 [Macrostomum lignano]
MLQTTSFIICGHMSKEDLDGVALGNSLINVAGMSIGMGMSTACDTLFSQTYGSRNRKRMGLYLQRSFLLMNLALLPLACLHLNIRPLLLLIGQAPEIAHRAALYMRLFLPGLLFNYLVLSRYLQNQSRMAPPMIAAFVANVFNASAQYVAIHVLDFSYLATAVVQAASMGMMFFITLAYILWTRMYRETWDGWKLESLYDWGDFIKLSVPGIFLIALEEWSFEVSTIVAGMLGAVQLAAQSIVFQLESISYMIPFGMSVAVNIRVGQQLGANQPVGAARSYRVGLVMTVGIAVLMCNLFVFLRHYLPIIFTTQSDIVSTAAHIIPLLGLFQLFDGISAVSCGAIRGTGRQVEGAVLLFIGYYIIGLPIGIPLALLTDLQMTGIWLGLLAGIAAEAVAFCCLVLSFNWRREAEKALERAYGRNWRRRLWQERRRRRILGVQSDSDEQEPAVGDGDGKNGGLLEDDAEGSPLISETESEFAPLLGGSSGFTASGFDSYGTLGGNDASNEAAGGDAVAVEKSVTDGSAAATTAAVDAAPEIFVEDIPRPDPEELAFYSDPEIYDELPSAVTSPPSLTAAAAAVSSTSAASPIPTAHAPSPEIVAATTAEVSPPLPSLLPPWPTVAIDPRRRRRGQSGRRSGLQHGRRRRHAGGFWGVGVGSGNLLYTGRFYGSSRVLLTGRLNEDDDEEEDEDSDAGSRPSVRSLLARRLCLLALLLGAVAGSALLMLYTDAWLDAQEAGGNATTTVDVVSSTVAMASSTVAPVATARLTW